MALKAGLSLTLVERSFELLNLIDSGSIEALLMSEENQKIIKCAIMMINALMKLENNQESLCLFEEKIKKIKMTLN